MRKPPKKSFKERMDYQLKAKKFSSLIRQHCWVGDNRVAMGARGKNGLVYLLD